MKTVCEANGCNGCMACAELCPKKCISVTDGVTAMNAVIDETMCIGCRACERVCPNLHEVPAAAPMEWYQGWAENTLRLSSSSGGAAAAITRAFLSTGGYVASCLFENGAFGFDITNDPVRAAGFRGSKYVKSNPAGIYKAVTERLKTNKVLFIGLPCQVAAMKNYTKNAENLFTIDLICHGTPSVSLLSKYLSEKGYDIKQCGGISFRDGSKMGLSVDGQRVTPEGIDAYSAAFLRGAIYTENCYGCRFAKTERVGDITLGDSWGTEYKTEERNGISLVLVQTEKGRALLRGADFSALDVDLATAIRENHQLRHPTAVPPERNTFFACVNRGKRFEYSSFRVAPKRALKMQVKRVLYRAGLWRPKK